MTSRFQTGDVFTVSGEYIPENLWRRIVRWVRWTLGLGPRNPPLRKYAITAVDETTITFESKR